MTVFVVFNEWEKGGDGGHCDIVGVYQTREAAESSQRGTIRAHLADGFQVWGETPFPEPEAFDEAEWDVDVHLDEQELR